MRQPAAAALAPLPFELVLDDGEPLETDWHTVEFPLLRKLILLAMEEQARTDFFVGANIRPSLQGRLWSKKLGAFLGLWHGLVEQREGTWVRLFRRDGTLVPTPEERAEAERQRAEAECQRADEERQRADAERQRADDAEAELVRLRALLEERSRG